MVHNVELDHFDDDINSYPLTAVSNTLTRGEKYAIELRNATSTRQINIKNNAGSRMVNFDIKSTFSKQSFEFYSFITYILHAT